MSKKKLFNKLIKYAATPVRKEEGKQNYILQTSSSSSFNGKLEI